MKNMNIGFIGLGLIGGSIAKTMKRINKRTKIIAYNRTYSVLEAAKADGTVDIICDTVDSRFADCDYIFLCMPVSYNVKFLQKIKYIIKKDCIITDVGSVKSDIHMHVSSLDLEENFIGGHPMTGSEKTGYENASDYLLENTYYIITPSEKSREEDTSSYYQLVKSLGAIPIILDYKEHDYMTATVSHVPHVIASSLVNLLKHSDNSDHTMRTIAAGGFKDLTRIASGSPVMWQQICLTNSDNICMVLKEYIHSLNEIISILSSRNEEAIFNFFKEAAQYRDSIPSAKGLLEPVYELYCNIKDETGAIATISTRLAKSNISIKNIGIIHNREFEHGALHIEFYDESSLHNAILLLKEQNYTLFHESERMVVCK